MAVYRNGARGELGMRGSEYPPGNEKDPSYGTPVGADGGRVPDRKSGTS